MLITMKDEETVVRNVTLYRAALALQPLDPRPLREILAQRRRFKLRPCQCCGRSFQPLGRWNCRCEVCRLLQDEDGLPPSVFADPSAPIQEEKRRSSA
jgi:hypothetical protein